MIEAGPFQYFAGPSTFIPTGAATITVTYQFVSLVPTALDGIPNVTYVNSLRFLLTLGRRVGWRIEWRRRGGVASQIITED
jgi:hypothetical protein